MARSRPSLPESTICSNPPPGLHTLTICLRECYAECSVAEMTFLCAPIKLTHRHTHTHLAPHTASDRAGCFMLETQSTLQSRRPLAHDEACQRWAATKRKGLHTAPRNERPRVSYSWSVFIISFEPLPPSLPPFLPLTTPPSVNSTAQPVLYAACPDGDATETQSLRQAFGTPEPLVN